jgi:hypothetical protein
LGGGVDFRPWSLVVLDVGCGRGGAFFFFSPLLLSECQPVKKNALYCHAPNGTDALSYLLPPQKESKPEQTKKSHKYHRPSFSVFFLIF